MLRVIKALPQERKKELISFKVSPSTKVGIYDEPTVHTSCTEQNKTTWRETMDNENHILEELGSCDVLSRPKHKKVFHTKTVLKLRQDAERSKKG